MIFFEIIDLLFSNNSEHSSIHSLHSILFLYSTCQMYDHSLKKTKFSTTPKPLVFSSVILTVAELLNVLHWSEGLQFLNGLKKEKIVTKADKFSVIH